MPWYSLKLFQWVYSIEFHNLSLGGEIKKKNKKKKQKNFLLKKKKKNAFSEEYLTLDIRTP